MKRLRSPPETSIGSLSHPSRLSLLQQHRPTSVPPGDQGHGPPVPGRLCRELGYVHQAINGQKGYHGVAILSRLPFRSNQRPRLLPRRPCRHVAVIRERRGAAQFLCPRAATSPIRPNRQIRPQARFPARDGKIFARPKRKSDPGVLVGDLNVAPLENDVWSHKQLLDVVSHTPVETELLAAAQALRLARCDAPLRAPLREDLYLVELPRRDWAASDRGRRLDHVWASPGLKGALTSQKIVKRIRAGKRRPTCAGVMDFTEHTQLRLAPLRRGRTNETHRARSGPCRGPWGPVDDGITDPENSALPLVHPHSYGSLPLLRARRTTERGTGKEACPEWQARKIETDLAPTRIGG